MNYLKELIENKTVDEKKNILECEITIELKKREEFLKRQYEKKYKENIKDTIQRPELGISELYQYLVDVDIPYTLDDSGHAIPHSKLVECLLGNQKKDNDCLLRMILNFNVSGLNRNLYKLINKFDLFENICQRSNGSLSLYSISDLTEIMKIKLYHLAPDERDIPLETLSKLVRSKKHLTEDESTILKKAKALHIKRKGKVCATIPTINGNVSNIQYEVIPFQSDKLLTLGIDVGNCLKVGGAHGEEFLEYCLTNKNAVIVALYDDQNNMYIAPFIRTGNTIHCNGIDPKPPIEIENAVVEALTQCAKEMCQISKTIDVAVTTDLHFKEKFKEMQMEPYELKRYIPIDASVYSDYNKSEMTNYILYKNKPVVTSEFYVSDEKFYQNRPENYMVYVNETLDIERLNIMINAIAYSSIEFEQIDDENKNRVRRYYKELDISKYRYVVGNQDWFVAIDCNLNITSYLLPYDIRAQKDYLSSLTNIVSMVHYSAEGTYGIRR